MIKRTEKPAILMIDDEARILRSLALLFKPTHKVFSTQDPAEFMQILQKEYIHIIVSDQRMPKARGTELLSQAKVISPHSMRILLTGYADSAAVIESVNDGEIYRYVTKPWDPNELKRTVSEATEIAVTIQKRNAPEEEKKVKSYQVPDSFSLDDIELPNDNAMPITKEKQDVQNDAVTSEMSITQVSCEESESSVIDKSFTTYDAMAQKSKVIIIDSDDSMYQKLSKVFSKKYELYHADTLEVAVDLLIKNDIAVAISDIMLGKVDIAPVLNVLKQTSPTLVTIVLTKLQDTSSLIGLINQGQIYRCLSNPITASMLDESIMQAVEQHHKLESNPNELLQRSVSKSDIEEDIFNDDEKVNAAEILAYVNRLKNSK